jgi:hypothetical protein
VIINILETKKLSGAGVFSYCIGNMFNPGSSEAVLDFACSDFN